MTDFQIIYLNGPSSSGKTTLARALQNKLEIPYLILGIDQIIFMMPEKLNDWHNETKAPGFSWQSVKNEDEKIIAYKIHTGPFGKKLDQAFKDIVVTLAKSDFHVIIDDVSLEGAKSVDKWRIALKDFTVLWIGVTAPLEILELREKERGDRKIGSARWQAAHVHSRVIYDLMIDTHAKSLYENINAITAFLNMK